MSGLTQQHCTAEISLGRRSLKCDGTPTGGAAQTVAVLQVCVDSAVKTNCRTVRTLYNLGEQSNVVFGPSGYYPTVQIG